MGPNTKNYLDSFINYELTLKAVTGSSFKLDRMKHLLRVMDNPQNQLKIVHIAGSKGKGSTCAFTAHVLKEAGYRVGLYTSPHIYNYRERIRILHKSSGTTTDPKKVFTDTISEEEINGILEIMKPAIQATELHSELGFLSFFEVYTALAFEYFRREKVDIVVLETGLGGRLDATNASSSKVGVITPISLEHVHLLGDTVEKIAKEKAAIIKDSKQRAVIAPQSEPVRKILDDYCRQLQIQPVWIGQDIKYTMLQQSLDGQVCRIESQKGVYEILSPLIGQHQSTNMAVALGVLESLQEEGLMISNEAIQQGFKNVDWPGRFEIIQKNPLIILDGAHNDASAKALVETLQDLLPGQQVTVVLGLSNDKDKKGIMKELNKVAHQVVATKSHHPRASEISTTELQQMFPGKPSWRTETVVEALNLIKEKISADQVVVVAGSLFVVSDFRKAFYVVN